MELAFAHEREVRIKLTAVPMSIQAKRERRDQIAAEIRQLTSSVPILFSGDVGVTIELSRSEQDHYETDRSADIDNVVKPILDGLVGPEGVMIDDNQVQNVQCYWIDAGIGATLTIDNRLECFVDKQDLVFIHMGKQLYFPLNTSVPKKSFGLMLDMLQGYKKVRADLEELGVPYNDIRHAMPIQRYFHKTRLRNFRCVELEDARRESGGED